LQCTEPLIRRQWKPKQVSEELSPKQQPIFIAKVVWARKRRAIMKTFIKLLIVAITMLLYSLPVMAASDGVAGETSTGTTDITVDIPPLVRISGMEDIEPAPYTGGAGGIDEDFDLCVYSNMAAAGNSYDVTMTSTSPWGGATADQFRISNNTNEQEIAYTVEWNDEDGTGGSAVTYNTPLTGQTGWSNDVDCDGDGDNANLRVQMTQTNLLAVLAGEYTGTLTVVISPE